MKRSNNYLALAGFGLLSLLVSILGGALSASSIEDWYATLEKPWFNPPDWAFGPAWTVLYSAMAVAAWWIWRHGPSPNVQRAMTFYFVQLALNLLWSFVFFGLRSPEAAFFQIIVLALAILATIKAFFPIDQWAAWLMVPYLAWVGFAALLNGAIVWLN